MTNNNYDEYNRAIEQYNEQVEVDNTTIDADNVVNKPFYPVRLVFTLILSTVGASLWWLFSPTFDRQSLTMHFATLWGICIGWFMRWLND